MKKEGWNLQAEKNGKGLGSQWPGIVNAKMRQEAGERLFLVM